MTTRDVSEEVEGQANEVAKGNPSTVLTLARDNDDSEFPIRRAQVRPLQTSVCIYVRTAYNHTSVEV